MSDKNDATTLTDDELSAVSGGLESVRPKEDGGFEYWIYCGRCGHSELILSAKPEFHCRLTGTFICPDCGWTRDYSINS